MNFTNLIRNPKGYLEAIGRSSTRLIRTYLHNGTAVVCENCGWHGKYFFNGECPKCKSLPRTRLIPFAMDYFKIDKPNLKVLHVAPNKTEYWGVKSKLHEIQQYDRMDIRAIKHVDFVEDLTQLSFEENVYDLVVIWHVFEHIEEDKKAIAEVYRVLRPHGILLMSVPIFPLGRDLTYEDASIPYKAYEQIHGHDDHCRSCGLDYYKRFEVLGFTTNELKVEKLESNLIHKFGLKKGHVAWCFTK
jgi:SAM-dependent methyltransferase